MVFSHANDSLSGCVKISVSITATDRLSDRLRDRRTDLQSVKFLVVEVAEVDYAIADQHRAATVLMHPRPGVETRRRQIYGRAIGALVYDDITAVFLRPALAPVNIFSVQPHVHQIDGFGHDEVGDDR